MKSVKRVRNIEELPNAISDALEKKSSLEDLNNYVSKIENSTFNFDHEGIVLKIHNTFYNNGFLVDTEIPISKMKDFLLEIKPYFTELVDSHIQKIQIYKQIEIDKKWNQNVGRTRFKILKNELGIIYNSYLVNFFLTKIHWI